MRSDLAIKDDVRHQSCQKEEYSRWRWLLWFAENGAITQLLAAEFLHHLDDLNDLDVSKFVEHKRNFRAAVEEWDHGPCTLVQALMQFVYPDRLKPWASCDS